MNTRFYGHALLLAALCVLGIGLAPTASGQDGQSRVIRFATNNPKGHPIVDGMEKFAEIVAAKSNGKIQVKLFPGAVLGSDFTVQSSLQGGVVDMTVGNSGNLVGIVKEFGLFDLPFLFASGEEADAVVDGPIGKSLHEKLQAKGLVGLAYWELGFRNLTNSRRTIAKAEDIAGLKLRTLQVPLYIDMFNALGANAIPMPFPEVYTALEQKAIDGQENPVAVIHSNKFNEVQKFLTMTRHTYNPQSVLFSKKIWDTLSSGERSLLADAATEAATYQRKVSRSRHDALLGELAKAGMQVTELAPAEVDRIRTKLKPVFDKHAQIIGADLVGATQVQLGKLRSK